MKDLTKYTLESPLNLTPASILDNFQRRVKAYVGDNRDFIEEGAEDDSPDAFAEAAVEHFQVSAEGYGEPQLDEQQAEQFRRTAEQWYRNDHGRFVPKSALADLAADLTPGLTQEQIGEAIGVSQAQVSQALRGQGPSTAIQIIEHYAGAEVEGPLYRIPPLADDVADRIRWEAYDD